MHVTAFKKYINSLLQENLPVSKRTKLFSIQFSYTDYSGDISIDVMSQGPIDFFELCKSFQLPGHVNKIDLNKEIFTSIQFIEGHTDGISRYNGYLQVYVVLGSNSPFLDVKFKNGNFSVIQSHEINKLKTTDTLAWNFLQSVIETCKHGANYSETMMANAIKKGSELSDLIDF